MSRPSFSTLIRMACGLAGAGEVAQAETGNPAATLTLFSGTVAQSFSRVATGPRELVTTYYQAEGAWPLARSIAVEFEVEGGQVVGNQHAETLSASLGSVYRLNDLQEDPELFVPNLFLSGRAAGGTVHWKLGRTGLQAAFDDNRVARAKRTKFLSLPFTRNAAVAFPGKGFGGALDWTPEPPATLTVGVGDANAISTRSGFGTLRGEYFSAAELTLRPQPDAKSAALRLLAWRTERHGVRDGGWAVSADAELAPATVAFLRLGSGSDHFARVRGLVAGGLAWENPFGRKMDFAGVGLSRGIAVANRHAETVAEAVYRWQAAPWLALSPDVQWIRHPAFSRVVDAWAVGLRCAVAYAR